MHNQNNVIDMKSPPNGTSFSACALVESYWASLAQKSTVPARSEINPRGIENALNCAFILESMGAGQARVRIAGMHLNDLMGFELRGMPASALFTATSREPFARALHAVLHRPAKMQLSLTTETGRSQAQMPAAMSLLPLKDASGQITLVLGCLESHGKIGRRPRRFTITEAKQCDLSDRPLKARQGGFAEPPAAFDPAPRAGHLRLVKSDQAPQ